MPQIVTQILSINNTKKKYFEKSKLLLINCERTVIRIKVVFESKIILVNLKNKMSLNKKSNLFTI